MKTPILSCLALSIAAMASLQADTPAPALVKLGLSLSDGSKIRATPVTAAFQVDQRIAGTIEVDWKAIKRLEMSTTSRDSIIHFANGDRMTACIIPKTLGFETVLGQVEVPVGLITQVDVTVLGSAPGNVALGKPVHGRDGASHGKGLAKHVTDGDLATHAKPPSSSFDYRIDLQNGEKVSYKIDRIVIHWGRFGDRFVGVRQKGGEGWASAAWPGEYVTSYVVECRKVNSDTWDVVHQFSGRPVDEKGARVQVVKNPTKQEGCSSESVTHIESLGLNQVAELRVRAKGGHWIGLFELEAFGACE